jgi:hypothetical protein
MRRFAGPASAGGRADEVQARDVIMRNYEGVVWLAGLRTPFVALPKITSRRASIEKRVKLKPAFDR